MVQLVKYTLYLRPITPATLHIITIIYIAAIIPNIATIYKVEAMHNMTIKHYILCCNYKLNNQTNYIRNDIILSIDYHKDISLDLNSP
jgi:hypothetical protein